MVVSTKLKKLFLLIGIVGTLLSILSIETVQAQSTKQESERGFETQQQSARISIEGAWRWNCCQGRYYGDMQLYQNGNRITGTFNSPVNSSGGSIDGIIQGSRVEFTIVYVGNFDGERQFYELTLSPNGQILEGTLRGFKDESVGVEFQAIRQ